MNHQSRVFIDADAFISLQFYKHSSHKKAIEITHKLDLVRPQAFTCTYVLLEVATVINMHFEHKIGSEVVGQIIKDPNIKVIKGDQFLSKGIEWLKRQKSKNVSLNDCVYFAIAEELQVDGVFSFDKHWEKNGFILLE